MLGWQGGAGAGLTMTVTHHYGRCNRRIPSAGASWGSTSASLHEARGFYGEAKTMQKGPSLNCSIVLSWQHARDSCSCLAGFAPRKPHPFPNLCSLVPASNWMSLEGLTESGANPLDSSQRKWLGIPLESGQQDSLQQGR